MQKASRPDGPRKWKQYIPRRRGSRDAPTSQDAHCRPIEEERDESSSVRHDDQVEEILDYHPPRTQREYPPLEFIPTFSSSESSNSRPRPSRATNTETLRTFFGRRLNRFSAPETPSNSSRPPSYAPPLFALPESSNADSARSNDNSGQSNSDSGPSRPSSGPHDAQPEPSTGTFDSGSGRYLFVNNAPCNIFTGPTVFNQETADPGPSSQFSPSPQPFEASPPGGTYTYHPLKSPNHIRLLRFALTGPSSTRGNQMISASLCEFELDTESSAIPAYKALSYEWGLPPKDESDLPMMLLDGCTVQIRQNLYDALTCMRQAKYGRGTNNTSGLWLWVDALCINQDDPEEKGHQVGLMKRIFKGADMVLVWLGMGDNRTTRAAMKAMNMEKGIFERAVTRQTLTDDELKGIQILCELPYWRRVWIMQEIVLARNYVVICRTEYVTMDKFERALKVLCGCGWEFKRRAPVYWLEESPANKIIAQRASERTTSTLLSWLKICVGCGFEATDKRDMVYALLGISDDCEGRIMPDYTMSVEEVYSLAIALTMRESEGYNEKLCGRLAELMELPWSVSRRVWEQMCRRTQWRAGLDGHDDEEQEETGKGKKKESSRKMRMKRDEIEKTESKEEAEEFEEGVMDGLEVDHTQTNTAGEYHPIGMWAYGFPVGL